MATSPQQEARSLSAINYLAANPPQYPYSPEQRESLTLYISRVPGTQDIILSTVRPQKKNVTGEDIMNSLYYIHLDSPQDELLWPPQRLPEASPPRSGDDGGRCAIPRKPVPGPGTSPLPNPSAGAAPSAPFSNGGDGCPSSLLRTQSAEITTEGYRGNPMFQKRRSGQATNVPAFPVGGPLSPSAKPIQRKPLGPEPRKAQPGYDQDAPAATDLMAQTRPVMPSQLDQESAYHAGLPLSTVSPLSGLDQTQTGPPGRTGRHPSSASFSLTVIRRDPASGTQCNIGKVSSFQNNVPPPHHANPGLDSHNMTGLQRRTIDIRLETSGYAKYRNMPTRAGVDAYRPPVSEHSYTQQMARGATAASRRGGTVTVNRAQSPAEEGFVRQVLMSYGPDWRSSWKKAFQRLDGIDSPERSSTGELGPPKLSQTRAAVAQEIDATDLADGKRSPPLITEPGPGLKPKGFVFLSPWDGRCEFRTSANGRTLKCRHILDDTTVKLDAREVAVCIRGAQAKGRSFGEEFSSALVGAKPVSELRFNLPSGARKTKAGRPNSVQLSGQFTKFLHRKSSSSGEDESDEDDDHDNHDNEIPMDLSLGKEDAGGGNRGKRVKLGKLIIHDEGLKMLDLVVAANMGVWWTTWGRTT
ncbi:hypothetical protein VTK26DRAFT_740 [Humicola hyalothermophila]